MAICGVYSPAKSLIQVDKVLHHDFKETGTRWLGREVVLIGMFGAIGAYAQENKMSPITVLERESDRLAQKLSKGLHLKEYEKARNSVELNKVNVGLSNKKAVYFAVLDIINGRPFKGWTKYFGGEDE